MLPPSPAPARIAVIVPVAAGEAPPPGIFFERVFGARGPGIRLVAAADPEISSNVRDAFARAGALVHTSSAPRGQRLREAALLAFEEGSSGARLARAAPLFTLEESSSSISSSSISSSSTPSSSTPSSSTPSSSTTSPSSAEIPLFLFLHADTLLPEGWAASARRAIAAGAVGGAFRLSFSGGGARMRWVAFWANARTAFTRMPYGDQAPFVRRDVYERLGGHRPWPLLDDWDFARRLRRQGPIEISRAAVETSPRRYLERGVARTVWKNWKTLWRFRRGASPEDLAKDYRT